MGTPSTSDCLETELPDGTTRRVYQYEWPPEKKPRQQNGTSGGYSFGPPKDAREAELRMLRAYTTMIERENRVLREDNEGKAWRIAKLERQLYEMREQCPSSAAPSPSTAQK